MSATRSSVLEGVAGASLGPWVEGQRFGLGASLLSAEPEPTQAHLETVFSPLRTFASSLGTNYPTEYLAYLSTLPLMSLQAMCRLDPSKLGEWEDHHQLWLRARADMIWDNSKELSPIAGAKLLANRILNGNFSAAQLIRIASLELGRDWSELPGINDALDELVGELRVRPYDTHSRPAKLSIFRKRMESEAQGEPLRWALVENCLLHQSFCWPLVVWQLGQSNVVEQGSVAEQAFALPIELHVALGGTGQVTVYSEIENLIDHDDWKSSAEVSLRAARMVWQHAHSSWDQSYLRLIEDAALVLDLRIAEAIAEPYRSDWIALELKESSLEAYLSLVILSNFLGSKDAMETVCATGVLRAPMRDRLGGDYYVGRPDHIEAKLDWATSVGLYDKFITARSDPTVSPPLSRRGHVRVCEVGELNEKEARPGRRVRAMLSDFAAEALSDSQRHRYVRCPDVSYAFRNGPGLSDADEVAKLIRANSQTVLALDASTKATTVAQALCGVNDAVRWQSDAETKLANFAFVRAVGRESNDRFWQIVWHLLRGSLDTFDRFRFSVDTQTPAKLLAAELNRFTPDTTSLRRAPDVLVIIGSNRVSGPKGTMPRSPFCRLLLNSIVEEVSDLLVPSPVAEIFGRLGRTRIILVPEEHPDKVISGDELEADIREYAQRLSIFRNGFRFQTAQHILPPHKLPDWDLEQLLSEMMKRDCGDTKLLSYSERANEYFLNARVELPKDGDALAELHSDAANAIVGLFKRDDDVLRSNFQEALTPAWLHEAEWHLGNAKSLFKDAKRKSLAIHEHERLSRIGEIFGWSRVWWAADQSAESDEEVLDAIRNHLDSVDFDGTIEQGGTPKVHPLELLWSARFAAELALRTKNSEHQTSEHQKYVVARERYFDLATRICVQFDFDPGGTPSTEGNTCRYAIATSRACILLENPPRRIEQAKRFFLDAASLVTRDPEVIGALIDHQWFELLGDCERDHFSALAIYRDGIINDRVRLSTTAKPNFRRPPLFTVVKYLGTARLAGVKPDPAIVEYVSGRPERSLEYVLERIESGLDNIRSEVRWKEGKRQVRTLLRSMAPKAAADATLT